MDTDYKEEISKLLNEYILQELKANGIEVEDNFADKQRVEFAVSEASWAAIDSADEFINEKVEELTEPEDPWDTGKTGVEYTVKEEGRYGQSGTNGYGCGESGVTGGQSLDSDRWKDAWGDN